PQANDHDLRRGTADGGDQNLIASLKPHEPVGRPTPPPSAPRNASPSSPSYDAFFHGLGHEGRFPPAKLNGRYRFRKRSVAVSDCRPGLLGQALRVGDLISGRPARRELRTTIRASERDPHEAGRQKIGGSPAAQPRPKRRAVGDQ